MKIKGINYDVGRILQGNLMRPVFDARIVHRELEIIKHDLHANTVKIQGNDIGRLTVAAEYAFKLGLNVWLAPELFDKSQDETFEYTVKAAAAAEKLRQRWPRLVLSIGTELTGFMRGIMEGNSVLERLLGPHAQARLRSGTTDKLLNAYLARTNAAIRKVFHGQVTYASLAGIEKVDWSIFDIVGVDLYRDSNNKRVYGDQARGYLANKKPVVITEFGCCTYRGAEDKGGMGFDVVDWNSNPPGLKGDYVYDQTLQARELTDQLRVLDSTGVEGAFVLEFVQSGIVVHDSEFARNLLKNVKFDLDLPSYALVKSLFVGHGTTYPDMPWEPKESFRAVADYYSRH